MKISSVLIAFFAAAALAAAQGAPIKPPVAPPPGQAAGPNPNAEPPLPPSPTVQGPSSVATINIEQAIESTQEGKKAFEGVAAQFQPKDTDLRNQLKTITDLQNKLNAQSGTMSQDAKDSMTRDIQTKQRDYQQAYQNAQNDYQQAQTDVMNTIGGKMMDIVKKYAEDHGYTYILDISLAWPQSPLLYFNPGTQITGDIVKLYDTAHPLPTKTGTGGN